MATTETDRPATVQGEVRMLIDGELVEAASGKRFDNINPATEEVLGQVADAGVEDMQRAIAAARRAFDETDWSTNHTFRKQCLQQLQAAIESEQEELRARARRRGRLPDRAHLRTATRRPARRRAEVAGRVHRPVRVGARASRRLRVRDARHAQGREGGGGRRRRDRAVELPVRGVVTEDRPGARHRQHRHPQARARHAVERDAPRSARRREDRHPGGVFNVVSSSDHLVGEELDDQPARRPHLVHRVDRDRQAHLREGRRRR